MAIERFINDFQTTLSSGINDSTTSIPVNAATSIAAQFRAKIDNEIIIITANGNTTTWTATRGAESTSAASHSSGATVTVVQTAGSFQQAIADRVRTGTYANLPSTSDALEGHIYYPTDARWDRLRFNGSSWDHYYDGRLVTPPPTSGWTWDNQQTATVNTTRGTVNLVADAVSAVSVWNVYHRAIPTVPYVLEIDFRFFIGPGQSQAGVAFGWRQSSDGKLHFLRVINSSGGAVILSSIKFTDSSNFSASYLDLTGLRSDGLKVKLEDNNTSRIIHVGNSGNDYVAMHTIGRTDFLTGDQLMLGVDSGGTTAGQNFANLEVFHWLAS